MLSVGLLEELRLILLEDFDCLVESNEELQEYANTFAQFGELWSKALFIEEN